MGSVLTLAILMVQGGIRDLLEGTQPASGTTAVVSFGTTILGGGLLAGAQSQVAKTVILKYTPVLRFEIDTSIERGNRILKLIEELEKTSPAPPPPTA